MLARLLDTNPSIIRRVALFTVLHADFLSPLSDFLSLSLVCRSSFQTLSKDSSQLYFDIFSATFDVLGPLSRLGKTTVVKNAKEELERRFNALKVLRRGELDDPDLTEALWIAYMMYEDSDKGHKNVKRILATGLNGLLNRYLRQRLYRGSEMHGPYPPPPFLPCNVVYFGSVFRMMRVPPISIFATLSFFAHKEITPPQIPSHLRSEDPTTLRTTIGPTMDDIVHFYEHCQTHFADFPGIDVGLIRPRVDVFPTLPLPSAALETPEYRLGALTGMWQGSFIVPYLTSYETWLNTLSVPMDFETAGRFPLYMSLEEHYVCDPNAVIRSSTVTEGTKNAWLPPEFKWRQVKNGIEVFDEARSFKSFYRTFRRGDEIPIGDVVDVIVTGKTDRRHAVAWGDFEMLGRVRLEDGLIVLARKPTTSEQTCSEDTFDIGPVLRRIGPISVGSPVLSEELPRRFRCLKSIRGRLHRFYKDEDEDRSHELIFLAYTLMLENEGNNEQQLREYAQIGPWLKDYWFHPLGASRAADHLRVHDWLPETPVRSMAMWLFWFLMRPGESPTSVLIKYPSYKHSEDYTKNNVESWDALNILKIFALAAHKYELTNPPWHQFVPKSRIPRTASIDYFSQHPHLAPPPLATPAILSFLTLVNKLAEGVGYSTPIPPSVSPSHLRLRDKAEWECEWQRCVILGRGNFDNILTDAFKPGSIEGVWEGMFTYTEFTAYAALLAGGEPHIIQRSMVVRHRQTWKLREHQLLGSDTRSDSGIGLDNDHAEPLPGGDPLRSYFPTGTQLRETAEGVEVQVPNRREIIYYQRASSVRERVIRHGVNSTSLAEFVHVMDSSAYQKNMWMEIEESGFTGDILLEMLLLTLQDGGVTPSRTQVVRDMKDVLR
ncbi:hypothetical protein H0H93_003268 [Arthromyces matolae]|nr:hypothetical protein H0H93_003268 [Arthromyces matolae]